MVSLCSNSTLRTIAFVQKRPPLCRCKLMMTVNKKEKKDHEEGGVFFESDACDEARDCRRETPPRDFASSISSLAQEGKGRSGGFCGESADFPSILRRRLSSTRLIALASSSASVLRRVECLDGFVTGVLRDLTGCRLLARYIAD
jgi:hypothetical protein